MIASVAFATAAALTPDACSAEALYEALRDAEALIEDGSDPGTGMTVGVGLYWEQPPRTRSQVLRAELAAAELRDAEIANIREVLKRCDPDRSPDRSLEEWGGLQYTEANNTIQFVPDPVLYLCPDGSIRGSCE